MSTSKTNKTTDSCSKTSTTQSKPGAHLSAALATCAVFSGAFLLFSLEPMVGRLITPFFGSASHVWLICLMFFQAMLFFGYLYAHLLASRIRSWHFIVLVFPLFNLPIGISAMPDPAAPILRILTTLVLRVALPFIALSTTAVVVQTWVLRSTQGQRKDPYPLYAASNAGSLVALLGYIFIVEPWMGLRVQTLIWSGLYLLYALLLLLTWLTLRPQKQHQPPSFQRYSVHDSSTLRLTTCFQWFILSALPSALLLAVTNYITQELGSFPFVWTLPLVLYLGSFIITFRINGGVPGFLKVYWLELLLMAGALFIFGFTNVIALLGHLGIFFLISLMSHGRLYEYRPPGKHLTSFYLVVALGGWFGGALISLVVPFVFTGLFEYPTLLILAGAAFFWNRHSEFSVFWKNATRIKAYSRMICIGVLLFPIIARICFYDSDSTQFRHRNFYGTYRIVDKFDGETSPLRTLIHGKTLHGAQLLDATEQSKPTSYYYKGGSIWDAYVTVPSPRRLAVIGLGTGSISAYALASDTVTYYEIDPDNEKIARDWFTYLDACKGKVRVVTGDGRLSLQNHQGRKYDLIIVDAFSGDGIPTHLLTKEALLVYLTRLTRDGIILFHISNRYYDLSSVIKATATTLGLQGYMTDTKRGVQAEGHNIYAQCVVLARDAERLTPFIEKGWTAFGNDDKLPRTAPWSDDYVNVLLPLAETITKKLGAAVQRKVDKSK